MASELTAKAIERFKRMQKLDVRVFENGGVLEYVVPGFTYNDFDRAGNVPIWVLLKHCEYSRIAHFGYTETKSEPHWFGTKNFRDTDKFYTVLRGQSFHVAREFYNRAGITCPLIFRCEPGSLGTSSYTLKTYAVDQISGKYMTQVENQQVRVNRENGQTEKIPEEEASFFKNSPKVRFYIATEKPPINYFEVKHRVQFSDYDFLQHVNAQSYKRWCLDAATKAALSKALSSFSTDIADNHVESGDCVHYSELFVPDIVTIKVWECKEQSRTLLFLIEKNTGDISAKVFFLRLKFYPPCTDSPLGKL